MQRAARATMWLALAAAFGCVAWFEYKGEKAPIPPFPSAVSAVEAPEPAAVVDSGAPVTSWTALETLDGLQGEWVGEGGPAVNDGGAINPSGATLHLDPMGSGRRWTLYAAVGPNEPIHCRLVNKALNGVFSGVCDKEHAVSFRFSRSLDGRLSFDSFATVLRRP